MTDDTQTQTSAPASKGSGPERAAALFSMAAPIAVPAAAPFLEGGATFGLTLATGAYLGLTSAAYGGHLSQRLLGMVPGGDILHGHRSTLALSSWMAAGGLASVHFGGVQQLDALFAGVLDPSTIPGIISLGWWGAWSLLPLKLRGVMRGTKSRKGLPAPGGASLIPSQRSEGAVALVARWAQYARPKGGSAPDHELRIVSYSSLNNWVGVVTAPVGSATRVTAQAVSSLYEIPEDSIEMIPGRHAGEVMFRVSPEPVQGPGRLSPSDLKGMWRTYVAKKGGPLPNSYVDEIRTKGVVTWMRILADDDIDVLPDVTTSRLAGALRTSPSLVSYEQTSNPREAHAYLMSRNPLETPKAVTSADELALGSGAVSVGQTITERRVAIPLFDEENGAQHVAVAGSTGVGKSGVFQILALGALASGSAIIYADPKGSSNPAIEEMAAYSGLADGALGSLRVALAILRHRKVESAKAREKTFRVRPGRPHIAVFVDECAGVIGEDHPEGAAIAQEIVTQGRSLAMSLVMASQSFNVAAVGSSITRSMVTTSGSVIVLRTSKDAARYMQLPDEWATVSPSSIPASWNQKMEDPFGDEDEASIPKSARTYGLGYVSTWNQPHPRMFRSWKLEDATPLLPGGPVPAIADFPGWGDDSILAEIARTKAQIGEKKAAASEGGDAEAGPSVLIPEAKTLKEQILDALEILDEEDGSGGFAVSDILEVAKDLTEKDSDSIRSTLDKLKKDGKVARVARGAYRLN